MGVIFINSLTGPVVPVHGQGQCSLPHGGVLQLPLGAEDNHTLLNHMSSMGEGFEGRGVFCVLCAGQFNDYVSV